jgi:BioD-like phosphotransacetylase family protein
MKIQESLEYQPITVTFETEGELAFFVRALGSTNGTVANKFNVSVNQQCKDYSTIYNKLGDDKMEKYPKLNSLSIQD